MVILITYLLIFISCNNQKEPPAQQIASTPQELQVKSKDLLKSYLDFADKNKGKINDSVSLTMMEELKEIYKRNQSEPAWSKEEVWLTSGDSLFDFIENSRLLGLFPEDYHYSQLVEIRAKIFNDSLKKNDRRDAALWARADLFLTDAFVHIVKDVRLGRLPQDSITMRRDSVLDIEFYWKQFSALQKDQPLSDIVKSLEPNHNDYWQLKAGIKKFLETADYNEHTKIPSLKDSMFRTLLQRRLYESGFIAFDSVKADSSQLAEAVKKFQKHAGINIDGKVGEVTLRMLNTTDKERFVRIAITMDRYKMLPEKMPDRYLWVNLPAYYLKLVEDDTVKLTSKIVCGKPITRSPVLNSSISELITYPQWTVPQSIIEKEILPAAKKNPSYITKKGFSLVDSKGNEIHPDSVNWAKYKKGIPYKVVQGSGDANALGVMKFNFSNKYAVYLHDTNQRSLFSNSDRAFSHGCIRVQSWEQLAFDILDHEGQGNMAKKDSVMSWLKQKQKHSVPVRNRLPLFIRYFTCEGKNGEIVFYDDVYGEDKMLASKYYYSK